MAATKATGTDTDVRSCCIVVTNREKKRFVSRCLAFLVLVPNLALAWGFDGHRRLASMMHEPLPTGHCLRTWFEARQTTALQDRACDPDRDRGTDPNEAPRHYLEIDWVTPPSNYPRDWQKALEQLRQFAERNGKVPWRVEEQYAGLVAAFRARDTAQVLDRAFFMSHYVTDSFSVLHDTKDFDPNDGLHNRWESDMMTSTNVNTLRDQARTLFGTPGRIDPRYATFDIVLQGQTLVSQLIAADVAAGGLDAGGGGYQRSVLFTQSRDMTARRWADALTVMSSLLWMAWADAGSPELQGFTPRCGRQVPLGEAVLRGYPVTWTPVPVPVDAGVDGGVDAGRVDASVADGGVDGGTGGGAGGGSGENPFPFTPWDAGVGEPMPVGCQCQATSGWWVAALFAAMAVARRLRA